MRRTLILVFLTAIAARVVFSLFHAVNLTPWPSWLPGPNLFGDFEVYLVQLHNLAQGYLLYRDIPYNYGPLFLYSMLPFYLISSKLASIPIVVSDAATASIIYLIVMKVSGRKVALSVGLGYALSPFALVNEGYLWLSSQPMTFFVIGMVYFTQRGRPFAAMIFLATAALFKQEALFILPPFLILYARKYGRLLIKGIVAGLATFLAGVGPFFVLAPIAFLYSMTYGFFISLGPAEPSKLAANLPSLASLGSSANPCSFTTIPNLYAGTLCGSIYNTRLFAEFLAWARVNQFVILLEPLLFVVFAFGLLAIRRAPNLFQLMCAFSLIGGLLLFSALVHGLFAYYFLPVYAILLTAATDRRTATVGIIALLTASFLSEGQLQLLLPLVSVFALVALQSTQKAVLTSKTEATT